MTKLKSLPNFPKLEVESILCKLWNKAYVADKKNYDPDICIEQALSEVGELECPIPSEVEDWIKKVSTKSKEMLAIMEKHNIVIDNLDDKMQKFAFTLYSEIVQLSSEADNLITKRSN